MLDQAVQGDPADATPIVHTCWQGQGARPWSKSSVPLCADRCVVSGDSCRRNARCFVFVAMLPGRLAASASYSHGSGSPALEWAEEGRFLAFLGGQEGCSAALACYSYERQRGLPFRLKEQRALLL